MDSDEIQECLQLIAGSSSTTGKQEMLQELLPDPDFARVVNLAYNPFIRFGVLQFPEHACGDEIFVEGTYEMLLKLASRELSGSAARQAISTTLARLTETSGRLLKAILLKDLRAGFGITTINKAVPKFLPEFAYMRCSLPKEVKLESFDWAAGCYVQLKADGSFATANDEGGRKYSFLTRAGQPYDNSNFSEIVQELQGCGISDFQFQGELQVYRSGILLPRKTGNGVLNRILKGGRFEANERPHYAVWDAVPMSVVLTRRHYDKLYDERFALLRRHVNHSLKHVSIIPGEIVHSLVGAISFAKRQQKAGLEGAIIKDRRGPWAHGTSRFQVKVKKEFICELRVLSILPGKGRNEATMGSLLCASECGELSTGVSGFTDAERRDITENPGKWLNSVISVVFESVITAEGSEGCSLYLARFDELREDRLTADDLQRILAIENS